MWEKPYQRIRDPKEMERIVEQLKVREKDLSKNFKKIQSDLQDSYSEALRSEYLNIQTELMLLRENLDKGEARLKELKRI